MIAMVVIPKKAAINESFMVRLKIIASGILRAAIAIMKARAVPSGIPFWKRTTATGTIAAQLPYMGTPKKVASGTEKMPVASINA